MRRRQMLTGAAGLAAAVALGARPRGGQGLGDPAGGLEAVLYGVYGDATAAHAPLDVLHRSLAQARTDFNTTAYGRLSGGLPKVIAQVQAAWNRADGVQRERAGALLAHGYALASELSVKLGEDALAWAAADRAHTVAQASGNPGAITMASRQVAISMRRHGHHEGAVSLLTRTARKLRHELAARPE